MNMENIPTNTFILFIVLFIILCSIVITFKFKIITIEGEIVEIIKSLDQDTTFFSLNEKNRLLISLDTLKIKTKKYGEITIFQNIKKQLNEKVKVKLFLLKCNNNFLKKFFNNIILDSEIIL